jgi:enamine deaminase RidA (YjgF/YER057c/UK114 family)
MRGNLAGRPSQGCLRINPVTTGIDFIRPPNLYAAAPYAYAAITDPGRMIFTAGACPLDTEGSTVAIGDVTGQARQVLANLVAVLEAGGARLSDVVKTTVYVASGNRDDLVAAWDVVRAAFGDHDAPSTLLGVAVLGYPDQLVEVEAVAVCHGWRESDPPHGASTVAS